MFLLDPFKVSLMACRGLYRPQINSSGRLATKHIQQLKQEQDLILKLAICFGDDGVVLQANGLCM